jgi:hypothetical protein
MKRETISAAMEASNMVPTTNPLDQKAALVALAAMQQDIAAVTAILIKAGDDPLTDHERTQLAELNQQFERDVGGLPEIVPSE